jgi:hypothetical protein
MQNILQRAIANGRCTHEANLTRGFCSGTKKFLYTTTNSRLGLSVCLPVCLPVRHKSPLFVHILYQGGQILSRFFLSGPPQLFTYFLQKNFLGCTPGGQGGVKNKNEKKSQSLRIEFRFELWNRNGSKRIYRVKSFYFLFFFSTKNQNLDRRKNGKFFTKCFFSTITSDRGVKFSRGFFYQVPPNFWHLFYKKFFWGYPRGSGGVKNKIWKKSKCQNWMPITVLDLKWLKTYRVKKLFFTTKKI